MRDASPDPYSALHPDHRLARLYVAKCIRPGGHAKSRGRVDERKAGFRGYPLSWILADISRGVGILGTSSPRRQREVHADLSAGIVSPWELSEFQTILQWIFHQHGHVTRWIAPWMIANLRPSCRNHRGRRTGQCITRADRTQMIRSFSLQQRDHIRGNNLFLGARRVKLSCACMTSAWNGSPRTTWL